ncbi:hypothetical protein [Roseateles sp. PN1]|uniref:hypothetical protein n=1 Tax=Roseateles sp. PN1 TaxID=3137372 RepID=UPI0031388D07
MNRFASLLLCPLLALFGLALGLQQTAQAQTQIKTTGLYRCGPEGRELRDSPCPGKPDTAPSPLSYDQPQAAQTQAAKAQAQQQARQADQMEQARLRQEAQDLQRNANPAGIDGLKGIAQAEPTASAPKSVAHKHPDKRKAPKAGKPAKPAKTVPGSK